MLFLELEARHGGETQESGTFLLTHREHAAGAAPNPKRGVGKNLNFDQLNGHVRELRKLEAKVDLTRRDPSWILSSQKGEEDKEKEKV